MRELHTVESRVYLEPEATGFRIVGAINGISPSQKAIAHVWRQSSTSTFKVQTISQFQVLPIQRPIHHNKEEEHAKHLEYERAVAARRALKLLDLLVRLANVLRRLRMCRALGLGHLPM